MKVFGNDLLNFTSEQGAFTDIVLKPPAHPAIWGTAIPTLYSGEVRRACLKSHAELSPDLCLIPKSILLLLLYPQATNGILKCPSGQSTPGLIRR